jgi:Putative Ig domain
MRHMGERGRRASLVVLLALAIAACGDEEDQGGQQSSVNTNGPSAGTVTSQNRSPSISGNPARQALVGQPYAFVPHATDPDGDPLFFSIRNMPGWASFSTVTGRMSGTPTASNVRTYQAVTIMVTAGGESMTLEPFDIQVVNNGTITPTNTAPSISGTPAPQALVGQTYTFVPNASDPDGDALLFSIGNKPSWATFNTATGRLSGTPTAATVGTYSAVTIMVTAGGQTTMLQPFDVQVVDSGSKSVSLTWVPPTENEDGTPLLNLAGYRIRYGNQSGNYPNEITLSNPGLTTFVVAGLVPNDYYFVMVAYNTGGTESTPSNEARFTLN